MDFAKRQMAAMGWSEGKGLGKDEQGMAEPLKTRIKMDSCGLGFDHAAEHSTQVWFSAIDDIVRSVKSGKKKDPTKGATEGRQKFYKKFVKTGEQQQQLSDEEEEDTQDKSKKTKKSDKKSSKREAHSSSGDSDNEETQQRTKSKKKKKKRGIDLVQIHSLTGLTCHKGARHGLTMSGKLARLEQQEKNFALQKLKTK